MTEVNSLIALANAINTLGTPVILVLLIAGICFYARYRIKKDDKELAERREDRLFFTNHLSGMIKENSDSNKELAVGLTKLSDSVDSFQSRCGKIQNELQNEVDRLKKG